MLKCQWNDWDEPLWHVEVYKERQREVVGRSKEDNLREIRVRFRECMETGKTLHNNFIFRSNHNFEKFAG